MHKRSPTLLIEWTIMAGCDGRKLFCAMSGIQRHAATSVATITEFADDPFGMRNSRYHGACTPNNGIKHLA
jgi:hypothetical protein